MDNLAEYLRVGYNIKKYDAIILFISISSSNIKIRTGEKLKKLLITNVNKWKYKTIITKFKILWSMESISF